MDYTNIATKHKLAGATSTLFVKYMDIRWPLSNNDFDRTGQLGYANEWAKRFKNGTEWAHSDTIGQEILKGFGTTLYVRLSL